jgi:hypothetical protein
MVAIQQRTGNHSGESSLTPENAAWKVHCFPIYKNKLTEADNEETI